MDHQFDIRRLHLDVHLGVTPEERKLTQPVEVSLLLSFQKALSGAKTDLIADTLCYGKVCESIKSLVKGREFHLVEYLAHQILENLENLLQEAACSQIKVFVHKLNPPVESLLGGVVYSCQNKIKII